MTVRSTLKQLHQADEILTSFLVFDEGKLGNDLKGARAEMDQLLEALRKPEIYDRRTKPRSALTEAHNSVWFRVLEVRRVVVKEYK